MSGRPEGPELRGSSNFKKQNLLRLDRLLSLFFASPAASCCIILIHCNVTTSCRIEAHSRELDLMEIESEGGQGCPAVTGITVIPRLGPYEIWKICLYHPGISRVEVHTRFVNQSPDELRKHIMVVMKLLHEISRYGMIRWYELEYWTDNTAKPLET